MRRPSILYQILFQVVTFFIFILSSSALKGDGNNSFL